MRYLVFLLPLAASAQVLNVTVLDYASVPPATLAAAREVFTSIYRKAGGQVQWTVETRVWRPDQTVRLADVPGDIVLRICTEEMAKSLVRKETILGYVQPSAERELARVATVFYHRVEDLKAATGSTPAQVLGTALAHELGHLLLGKGAHSRAGIMRCPWDTQELRAIHRGQLVFDRRQSLTIVNSIAARTGLTMAANAFAAGPGR